MVGLRSNFKIDATKEDIRALAATNAVEPGAGT
jgi:hypothetical protein